MRLFISHGLNKKATADMQFLTGLVDALQAPARAGSDPAEVLVDRDRLQAGDAWRDVLHEWLAECDAGLLLLSQRALDSPWVLKEATVLAYRKAMDPGFPLYPVLLEGLQSEALASKGFSPLCLRELQAIRTPAAAATNPAASAALDSASALAIAHTVRQRLTQWRLDVGQQPNSPLATLQALLQTHIQRASNLKALERLCQQLSGRPLRWRPSSTAGAEPARLIAALLASGLALPAAASPQAAAARPVPNPLAQLIDSLRTHCGLRNADAAELLPLLSPLWTPAGNAAVLADVAGRNRLPVVDSGAAAAPATPPPGMSVALQCSLPEFSIDQHVRRVLLPTTRQQVLHVLPAGTSDNRLAELKQAVREAFRNTVRPPPGKGDDWIDAQLARSDKPLAISRTVFFVVPDPLPDAALLADLQASFPRLTFILQSASALPATLPPRVLALEPVPPDHEFDMQTDLGDTQNLIGL